MKLAFPLWIVLWFVGVLLGHSQGTLHPMPMGAGMLNYTLYWGAYTIKFHFSPDQTIFIHRDTIAPELLREIMRRQPRIWTGDAMLPEFQFTTGQLTIKSNASDLSQYRKTRPALEDAWAYLGSADSVFVIADLPYGRRLEIYWHLSGNAPQWLPANTMEYSWTYDPIKYRGMSSDEEFIWGGKTESILDRQFITVDELFNWLWQEPVLIRNHNQLLPVEEISVFFPYLNEFPIPDQGWRHVQLLPSLREWLYSVQDFLKPGVGIVISAIAQDDWPQDTFTIGFGSQKGKTMVQKSNIDILSAQIVTPDDPCLALRRTDVNDYLFEWGNYTAVIPRMYARSYSGPNRILPDRPDKMEVTGFTKEEVLEMLSLKPRIYRDKELLLPVQLQLQYNDEAEIITLENGVIPPETLTRLADKLKTGGRLTIFDIKAGNADLRVLKFIFFIN